MKETMRGYAGWSYRPYVRLTQWETRLHPTICRIAPGAGNVELEWFDRADSGAHTLLIGRYPAAGGFADILRSIPLLGPTVTVNDLVPDSEVTLTVVRDADGVCSKTRIARISPAVGVVVNYLHPDDTAYDFSGHSLCSPSLVKLPCGALLASMDIFSGGAPQNLTLIFRSDDGGQSWRYVTELFPCFWGKLFWHRGRLYMLATTTEYGNLVIGCSDDEGMTWQPPVTLLPGAGKRDEDGPHKAPMQIIEANGRLYTGIDYGCWPKGGHASGLLSIDADADLMCAENWVCTGFLPYDPAWPGAACGTSGGGLEGNAVQGPDGEIYNLLRYQMSGCTPAYGKALLLKADKDHPEAPLQFHSFVPFNGGANSKFELLYDAPTNAYWAIASEVVEPATPTQRNVLSLAVSRDLESFEIVTHLIDRRHTDPLMVGFQYVSALIDGDDLLYLCRTAMNNAANFHDANYSTFHRIKNFRTFMPK